MNIKHLIQLLFVLFLFGACQKDEQTISQSPNNIVANSPLAKLISRTSQNPTSLDNVLDNSSLISVKLPVTVIVDGYTIPVNTKDDYQSVQDVKDDYSNDNDMVYFNYPITIQLQNYSTQVINNYNELHYAIEACGQDDGLNEISCIAFNFPIAINIYNSTNQVASTTSVQNNQQLYNFITTLSNNIIAAFVYPISVTDSNGQHITINTNAELETFIDSSIDDCDSSGGGSSPNFLSTITSGSWYVSYFYDTDYDETYNYNGFNFTFINNNTINVIKNAATTSGSWSSYTNGGQNKLNLSFSNSSLHELQEDWTIIEYTPTTIHLKHTSGGGGGEIHYLYFTKN